ncbi:GntR family transcriptional regulator [Anaerofustis sp.]|uniref:FadR/GntR family transcriptional regulator n=1 Tax=Anaerofustis sp. TaxID=1872517 RepID=UPI0025C08DDE|nr:GntR family transcriptional regulator [Anaerofustis sp.]
MEIEKKNLTQNTADILRNFILKDHLYKPGEKLPNENILSSKLGVSRSTLREAIRILVSEGILDVQRGRGTFVTNTLNRYTKSNIDIKSFSDMKITLRDLYETRMIFEPEAAALACKRAKDKEIENILLLGEKCQDLILENPLSKKRIKSESEFHGSIIKASHNEFISSFLPVLTQTIEKTFALNFNLDIIAKDAYKDHIMIMNFLKKRDAEALKSAVTIHLHHAFWTEELSWK